MRILLINHYAGSTQHGMEYRPFYLAREWTRQGHCVRIVAGSFSHLRQRNPQLSRSNELETLDGVAYTWLQTPSYSGNGLRRVCSLFAFPAQVFRYSKSFLHTRYDAVIASSTYPFDIFPAKYIAHKLNAKLVFEVHDLWPLSPIEIGNISPRHPFMIMLQLAENFAYRNADIVISMLPKALPHMQAHGLAPSKFHCIPNGISLDEWHPENGPLPAELISEVRRRKMDGHHLIGYAGSIGASNALEYFLQAARILRSHKVTFVLVGQGPEKTNLQEYVKRESLGNVLLFPPITKKVVPSFLREMDSLYIGWRRLALYQYGISPNKVLDYMMAARPILHSVSAGNDPVQEAGCGISCAAEDVNGIVEGVLALVRLSSEERTCIGQRGKEFVMNNHSYSVLAERFLQILRDQ